jgi:starch-binding outer membrane protein, SusD/RagB family
MRIYKILMSLSATLLLFTACSDGFLNRVSTTTVDETNFYTSKEEMRLATAPLYTEAWFLLNDKAIYQIGDGMGGTMNSPYGFNSYIMMNVSTLDSKIAEAWQAFYAVVAQSNAVITAIQNKQTTVSQADKNQVMAEAMFMRGTAYFYLVRNWGPVVLYENNADLAANPIRKLNTVNDVYRFVIRDLEFAAKWLPKTDEAGRVTKWTAEGMLAKAYLVRSGYGSTDGTRDVAYLAKAQAMAADVCNNSGLTLMDNYADLFYAKNNNNRESLFALQWMETPDFWGKGNDIQAYFAANGTIAGVGDGWNVGWASYDMLRTYENADTLRRNATFMSQGVRYTELNKSSGGYTWTGTSSAPPKKYVIGSSEDAGVQVYRMSAPINTYMLRLSDVYLTYAEAILGNNASTSDPEALKYFNNVRTRAKLSTKGSITLDDIYYERHVEFALEGQFWYDLVARYYFQPVQVLEFINKQDRTVSYTYKNVPGGSILTEGTLPANPLVAADAKMRLPYPEVEIIQNGNFNKEPEAYNFTW